MNAFWLALQLSCELATGVPRCTPPDPATAASAIARPHTLPQQAADEWFGPDKLQHFTLSWGITTFAFAGAQLAGAEGDARIRIAASLAFLAGLTKELVDVHRGQGLSLKDLVVDALGIATAWAILNSAR